MTAMLAELTGSPVIPAGMTGSHDVQGIAEEERLLVGASTGMNVVATKRGGADRDLTGVQAVRRRYARVRSSLYVGR